MFRSIAAAITAISFSVAGSAYASSLPAVNGDYTGEYHLQNAFSSHGLWLPGFLGDNTWSVESGQAIYKDGELSMSGQVRQSYGGSEYFLNFDFTVFETTDAPNGLVCGGGHLCNNATQEMRDNIVHFDMGTEAIMGTVVGTGVLDGLSMDITMRPLSGLDKNGNPKRKPGQLGYGGNWTTLDFGYSNWLRWDVTSGATSGFQTGLGGKGDVNLDLIPAPLPAGLPLILTAGLGFYAVRRKQKAA